MGQKVEFPVVFVANWVLVWYDRKDYIEKEYTEGEYYVNKQAEATFGAGNGQTEWTPIFQVGKNGVTLELRDTVYHALEARELVKSVFWIIICWCKRGGRNAGKQEQAQRWYR